MRPRLASPRARLLTVVTVLLGSPLLGFGARAAAPPELAPASVQRLEAGETVVEMGPWEGSGAGEEVSQGRALRVLDRPPEMVLRAVRDLAHYHEFMPFMAASTPGRGADGGSEVAVELDLPLPQTDRHYAIRVARDGTLGSDGHEVAWEMVPGSGNVRFHRGAFRLTPWPGDETLVEIRLANDPGGLVPRSFQRDALRETLPWVLDGLRQHVGRCRYQQPVPDGCTE